MQENASHLSSLREELRDSHSYEEVSDIIVSCEDVYDLLYKLDDSKASGPDDVSGQLLRVGAPWLANPLARLFSLSLTPCL